MLDQHDTNDKTLKDFVYQFLLASYLPKGIFLKRAL